MGARRGVLLAAAALAAVAGPAWGAPVTTVEGTIQDCDGDNRLEHAAGEPHVPLEDAEPPCEPATGDHRRREPRPRSLVNFLHLTDFQLVDEESPARVEFLDSSQRAPGLNPFSAAYRPQESLTTQVNEAMVRQARNTVSPVTGAKLDLTILTGDNADSQQYNETRWFIDILDGTTGAGDPDPDMHLGHPQPVIVPDSGLEGLASGCDGYVDNGSVYDGVRGGGGPGTDAGYYEPDGPDDGDGYTPDRTRNQAEVPGPHADVTMRDFPGLFEAAQQPFEAVGLGMPWYTAFGNHDALVQGNSPDAFLGPFGPSPEILQPGFDRIARGCLKPSKAGPGTPTGEPGLDGTAPVVVPPDPRRCFLAKDLPNTALAPCDSGGWIQQHSRTTGLPVGHGFEPFALGEQSGAGRPAEARANHDGYYAFSPRPKLRFLVLDTVTDECGASVCSEGSLDHLQFKWLDEQLTAADNAKELALVFSHHTQRTIRMPSTDPTEQPVHWGERTSSLGGPETLEELLCRHPSAVAHVNGHEHANEVRRHECPGLPLLKSNPFWEVSTAAHIDWPQQSRMVELVDVAGKVELVLTIIDHSGAPDPAEGAASDQPVRLASIARELAYNDYQGSRGARGDRADRNVVLATGKDTPTALR